MFPIYIYTFGYQKSGIPQDNGGGYVFDCRFLENPGRHDQYKRLTGLDSEVQNFIVTRNPDFDDFMNSVYQMIMRSISCYIQRGYHDGVMISFGCTGGQHRSVFCAETLAKMLNKMLPKLTSECDVKIIHTERLSWL